MIQNQEYKLDKKIQIKNQMQQLQQQRQQQQRNTEKDLQSYAYVLQKMHLQLTQIKPLSASNSLMLHIIFKVIATMLFYFEQIFNPLITDLVTAQLCIIFTVIDFWFTKNVTGRRLVGARWFFREDEYGTQRFMYQARLNQQYVNTVNVTIFWVMIAMYIIVAVVDLITNIIMMPNIYLIQFQKLFLNVVVITGGTANLFMFYLAVSASTQKIIQLKAKLGNEVIRKLGPNSVVSFL